MSRGDAAAGGPTPGCDGIALAGDPRHGRAPGPHWRTEAGDPAQIIGAVVTPGFFETLGVAPALGRTFGVKEGEAGGGRVGWRWAGVQFAYMLALAYGAAWLVYRVGLALGMGG